MSLKIIFLSIFICENIILWIRSMPTMWFVTSNVTNMHFRYFYATYANFPPTYTWSKCCLIHRKYVYYVIWYFICHLYTFSSFSRRLRKFFIRLHMLKMLVIVPEIYLICLFVLKMLLKCHFWAFSWFWPSILRRL